MAKVHGERCEEGNQSHCIATLEEDLETLTRPPREEMTKDLKAMPT
jgi:hypothetical protein